MADSTGSPWWRGGVIYQIYPRSFLDTDGDGVGDLAGIEAKITYLARLGVDGIWICPFYPSPMADFGYDVADYRGVDPMFGTLEGFKSLLATAHAAGLKVIVDQVYSHTSDKHPWFEESRASRENPKSDWYVWADPKPDGSPPNNWLSVFGGPAWEWDSRRRQYYLHNFLASQPDLNFWSPAVRAEILGIAEHWLALGVDGFRLDVANYYFHDRLLRDNPAKDRPTNVRRPYTYQRHLYDRSQPETLGFLKDLRATLDRHGDTMSVAEVFSEAYVERPMTYTTGPERLHTAYSFWFLEDRPLTAELVRDALSPWSEAQAWPSWSFSNHDVVRAPTRWGGPKIGLGDADPRFVRLLLTLLLSLRGTIFLYQGEELGLPQADVPFEKLKDPEGLRFWPYSLGRDGCRTPMPWTTTGEHAGFSSAEPWLPIDLRHHALAVDAQEVDPGSVLAHTRRLIALRRASPALRTGALEFLIVDGPALVFSRTAGAERIVCAFNLGGAPLSLPAGQAVRDAELSENLGGQLRDGRLELEPYGAQIFKTP
jgi:alpha-glucosidase